MGWAVGEKDAIHHEVAVLLAASLSKVPTEPILTCMHHGGKQLQSVQISTSPLWFWLSSIFWHKKLIISGTPYSNNLKGQSRLQVSKRLEAVRDVSTFALTGDYTKPSNQEFSILPFAVSRSRKLRRRCTYFFFSSLDVAAVRMCVGFPIDVSRGPNINLFLWLWGSPIYPYLTWETKAKKSLPQQKMMGIAYSTVCQSLSNNTLSTSCMLYRTACTCHLLPISSNLDSSIGPFPNKAPLDLSMFLSSYLVALTHI